MKSYLISWIFGKFKIALLLTFFFYFCPWEWILFGRTLSLLTSFLLRYHTTSTCANSIQKKYSLVLRRNLHYRDNSSLENVRNSLGKVELSNKKLRHSREAILIRFRLNCGVQYFWDWTDCFLFFVTRLEACTDNWQFSFVQRLRTLLTILDNVRFLSSFQDVYP